LALTSNIMQEHPFNFARKMSTLDHASNGRIAWNIVTNPLTNAAHNFGQDLTPHDERYEWASEYVDVAYKLWEGSWDDGALLQDRKSGISGDYDKIHRINHVGERYSVEGPHLVSPSPQRTPLLFQAGSSEAGMNFAAANAEAQFLVVPRPEIAASVIETTRNLLPKYGRSREDIKFFQGLSFMVGSTEAEAARKSNELDEAIDLPAMMAHLGGGIEELDAYDLDQPLADIKTEGIRSILDWVQASVKGRKATVRDFAIRSGRSGRVTGTPEQIADRLEIWQAAGIDGINVINATIPGSYTEFITHVMPELQKRGLAKREYTPGTLRHKLFGRDTLSDTHPAAAYRGAFR
ncbi:MAG: LLM class flavin-dependent oxidoreductase, partial [Gammaproteobacteria bacterium]